MSVLQPQIRDRSPGELASNNPFRQGATSPFGSISATSPTNMVDPQRPVSRNPFLDPSGSAAARRPSDDMSLRTNGAFGAPPLKGNAAELFENLTLEDSKPRSNGVPAPDSSTSKPVASAPRPENDRPARGMNHRPTKSREDELRARKPPPPRTTRPRAPSDESDIFADPRVPTKHSEPRRRRNSDTSVVGGSSSSRPLDPEEERRRQERKRRERRHRERKEGGKEGESSRPRKPNHKLDIIDKLDVTGIYGPSLFHHDGPFDACNPHRNKAGKKHTPMSAFPANSANMSLGGSGPINRRPDHATFLGNHDEEAFKDYTAGTNGASGPYDAYDNVASGSRPGAARKTSNIEVTNQRIEPVHGDESLGLGSSTFLEGAPASRAAIQRRESDTIIGGGAENGGGLSRKKSLAQKIRGINNRRDFAPSGRMTNPEPAYASASPETYGAGGRSKASEKNPFFNEYSKGDDQNGKGSERITVVERENRPGRARAPSSPKGYGSERRTTDDGTDSMAPEKPATGGGGGFLSRVKSLKGGRKPREARPLV